MITYFPHDVNARNDEKMLDLRMNMGAVGIGIYWMLIEKLATANGQRLEYNLNKLSWDLHIEALDIKRVVEDYGLFEVEGGDGQTEVFYSKRLCEHAQQVESVSAKRSKAGRSGAEAKNGAPPSTAARTEQAANVQQMISTCQANAGQDGGKCQANAEPKKRIEENKTRIKENKTKEKSSSSEDAHTREEAAGAAEEEEGCFKCDLFELRDKAIEAIGDVYELSPDKGVIPMSTFWKTGRWLSCESDTDRETLKRIMMDESRKGKTFYDLNQLMQVADRQRPIRPIPLPYWDAMMQLNGLNSGDLKTIRERLGRNRQRWDDLVKALGEVNEKIRQPGRFLLSRIG